MRILEFFSFIQSFLHDPKPSRRELFDASLLRYLDVLEEANEAGSPTN
jgi:hypothetical protein